MVQAASLFNQLVPTGNIVNRTYRRHGEHFRVAAESA